jgi:pimeloyl-ACP methyl ester carboxylesterase
MTASAPVPADPRPDPAAEAGFEVHQGQGFDGTALRYWTRRREPRWLLVCNGYGGTLTSWLPLFSHLDPSWSVLIWDYRGQFGSDAPESAIPVADHSRDLDVLREHEGIERGVVVGWSVGVQVALEHFRRRPEQTSALVLVNGAHEQVLHGPLGGGLGAHLIRAATCALAPVVEAAQPALHRLLGWPRLSRIAQAIGMVRGNVEVFRQATACWQELELGRYLRMTLVADEHRTADILPRVDVPCLITCGDRDRLTPPHLAHALHDQITGSELFVLPGATHYAIMEQPEAMARAIDDFLARKLPWLR